MASKRKGLIYRSGRPPDGSNEELECAGSESVKRRKNGARRNSGEGKNRIMIYGPKNDATYIIEFKRPRASRWRFDPERRDGGAQVFPERMPYGLSCRM